MIKIASVKTESERNYSLDIARVIAILLVVMIHASTSFVKNSAENTLTFLTGNIFDSVSRAGVPLFLMISGALLLDESKNITPKDMFRKALATIGLLIAWSIIYAVAFQLVFPILTGEPVVLFEFIKHAVAGHFHMWYLYMLVGIYLATPFLRCFVKKENSRLVLLYIAVSMISTYIRPLINILVTIDDIFLYAQTILDKFRLDFFSCFITYYLTGWYIVHIGIEKNISRKTAYLLGILSIAVVIGLTQITGDYENMYSNSNILIYLYSSSIFLFINQVPSEKLAKNPKLILTLSKLSFGVYIIHAAVNSLCEKYISGLPPLLHIGLQYTIVLVSSFFFSYALSRIPFLKKLVRG